MELLEFLLEGLIGEGFLVPNSLVVARRLRLAWSVLSVLVASTLLLTHARAILGVVFGVAACLVAVWTFLFATVDLLKEWPESRLSAVTVACSGVAAALLLMVCATNAQQRVPWSL